MNFKKGLAGAVALAMAVTSMPAVVSATGSYEYDSVYTRSVTADKINTSEYSGSFYALMMTGFVSEVTVTATYTTKYGDTGYALICTDWGDDWASPDVEANNVRITGSWHEASFRLPYEVRNEVNGDFSAITLDFTINVTDINADVQSYVDSYGEESISGMLIAMIGESTDYGNGDGLIYLSETFPYDYHELEDGTICIDEYLGSSEYVVIPDTIEDKKVTQIGERAFYWSDITFVSIPEGVTSIGSYAFYGCRSLASAELPGSVTSIGYRAFMSCTALVGIEIPDSVTQIGFNAFENCSALEEVKIPAGVTEIAYAAFAGCSSLAEVEIPDKVTSIGGEAFKNCTSLDGVKLPDGLTLIGSSAFQHCTSLTAIEIPAAVASIEDKAFLQCDSLTAINVNKDNKNYTSVDGVLFNKDKTSILCYPAGKGVKEKTYSIPDTVTSIGQYAFEYCTGLTGVKIPDSVTLIGQYAFDNCTSLAAVEIPGSVTSIGSYAFAYCDSLAKVGILEGKNPSAIGNYAFYKCNSLEGIEIPGNVTSIGICAFGYCTALEEATMHEGVTSIGAYAFQGCTSLTKADIPGSVTYMGAYVFLGCTALKDVEIADGATVIGESAFYGCTALEEIEIPDSVTDIGRYAFRSCTSLEEIDIPASVTEIAYGTFQDCSSLVEVGIPSGVTTIDTNAFMNCSSLEEIEIPDSVLTIGDRTFMNCTSLTELTIPASVVKIGVNAFAGHSDDLVIYGYTGSYIEEYAKENDLSFKAIGFVREDEDSGIQVAIDSSDTAAKDANLTVTLLPKDTEYIYDISLVDSSGKAVQPTTEVTVVIPVPEQLEGASKYYVYHQDEKGVLTDMNASYAAGYVTFTTTHFSTYILTTEKLITVTIGDVNGDGKINDKDVVMLARSAAGWGTEIESAAADINGDGKINDKDVVELARKVAGWTA